MILERGRGRERERERDRERERERQRERERNRNPDLLFHLFTHSLVASCVCPDWESNPQFWRIGMAL